MEKQVRESNLKEWVKPFETKVSLKKIGDIEVGIIDQKEEHCYKHKIDFESECHKFPSGKIKWSSCPKCRDLINLENCRRGVPIDKPIVDTIKNYHTTQVRGF